MFANHKLELGHKKSVQSYEYELERSAGIITIDKFKKYNKWMKKL